MQIVNTQDWDTMLKEQAQKTADAIENYRRVKFRVLEQIEKVDDVVFYLLGKNRYDENLDAYEDLVVKLLNLLLQPDIAEKCKKHLLEEERSAIAKMLYQLYEFFKSLDEECYRTLFELKYVSHHYADDNLERLVRLEQQYGAKLEALLDDGGNDAA